MVVEVDSRQMFLLFFSWMDVPLWISCLNNLSFFFFLHCNIICSVVNLLHHNGQFFLSLGIIEYKFSAKSIIYIWISKLFPQQCSI